MKKFYYVVILMIVVIGIVGCVKDPGAGNRNNSETIPENFDWKTTRNVAFDITVSPISGVANNFVRTIKIFRSPLLNDSELVSVGGAKPGRSFSGSIIIPSNVTELYVQEILPNGLKTVRRVAVADGNINVNVRQSAAGEALSGVSSLPSVPTVNVPASFDVTIDANPSAEITLGGDWQGAKSTYYIPAGVTVTKNINFANWKSNQATLYVAGKLTLSSPVQMDKASLVILDGGEVTVTTLNASAKSSNVPSIYVFEGGKFNANKINISSSQPCVNYGEFKVSDKIDLNGKGTFYNVGKLSDGDSGNLDIIFSNSTMMENDGQIVCNYFEINSHVKFNNYENSILTFDEYNQSNSTGYMLVKGSMIVTNTADIHGVVDVHCHMEAGLLETNAVTFNMFAGSMISSEEASLNGSTFKMAGGSLFVTDTFLKKSKQSFINTDNSWAVVQIKEYTPEWKSGACSATGLIEVVYANVKDPNDFKKALSNGAVMVVEQTVDIAKSDCNGGSGSITPPIPDEDIVDKDGDGVPDTEDIDDNDPEVAYRITGVPYTYCFEDNWPYKGDYDMNDVVLGLQAEMITNAQNKVVYLNLKWEVKALGSYNDAAIAVQLDNVAASQIVSIESTYAIKGNAPFNVSGGLETGLELAVVPMVNNARETMPMFTTYANTELSAPKLATTLHTSKIKFSSPVELSVVDVNSLNVFILSNKKGETLRGKEVHLAGYAPTALADPIVGNEGEVRNISNPYKTKDGLMWGLMVPDGFRYPVEFNDIRKAYSKFNGWASSGGTINTDWYELENGDGSMIYNK